MSFVFGSVVKILGFGGKKKILGFGTLQTWLWTWLCRLAAVWFGQVTWSLWASISFPHQLDTISEPTTEGDFEVWWDDVEQHGSCRALPAQVGVLVTHGLLPWVIKQQQVKSPAQGVAGHQFCFFIQQILTHSLRWARHCHGCSNPQKSSPCGVYVSMTRNTQSKIHRMFDGWWELCRRTEQERRLRKGPVGCEKAVLKWVVRKGLSKKVLLKQTPVGGEGSGGIFGKSVFCRGSSRCKGPESPEQPESRYGWSWVNGWEESGSEKLLCGTRWWWRDRARGTSEANEVALTLNDIGSCEGF